VNLDMGEERDVSYSFDLRYDAPDADGAPAVDVAVVWEDGDALALG